jgi:putative acetyltransferase
MSEASFHVRPEHFESADAIALRDELAAELMGRYGADVEPGTKPSAADLLVFLVVRDGAGAAVGIGGLRRVDDKTLELKRMFVRPAARGQGAGALLLAELERLAAELGATRLRLETGTAQTEALGLYKRAGYRSIPCWGAYAGEPYSRCFERSL